MKLRLYHDTRKENSDALDAWSLYFPYSKKMREDTGIFGIFLSCKPTEDGMIRCGWNNDDCNYPGRPFLGERVNISDTPKAFQKIADNFQKLWNDVVTYGSREAWRKFNLA